MTAPSAAVSIKNGTAAAANFSDGSTVYVTPGNMVTIALQSTTGVVSGTIQMSSDYGPYNQSFAWPAGFSLSLPMPAASASIKITSLVSDGNNDFTATYTLLNYATAQFNISQRVRAVGFANVNTANANVNSATTSDNVALSAGDAVLLVAQTNAVQNGVWQVGAKSGNFAPLTRPAGFATGFPVVTGQVFEVGPDGAKFGNSTWKITASDAATVDASNLTLYPRMQFGSVTNVQSAAANNINANVWVLSNATPVFLTNTTAANATKVTTVSAGAGGTGFVVVAGTSGDNATWMLQNW